MLQAQLCDPAMPRVHQLKKFGQIPVGKVTHIEMANVQQQLNKRKRVHVSQGGLFKHIAARCTKILLSEQHKRASVHDCVMGHVGVERVWHLARNSFCLSGMQKYIHVDI